MRLHVGADVARHLALVGRVRRRQFEIGRFEAHLLGLAGEALANRLRIGISRHVDHAQEILSAGGAEMLGRHDADLRPLLTDEPERSVGFPLVLSRLVDVNRNAGGHRLPDQRIDNPGDEVADDDRVGLLGDRRLHGAGGGRLDVGLVNGDIIELDAERLRRVLRALVERRKERVRSAGRKRKRWRFACRSAWAGDNIGARHVKAVAAAPNRATRKALKFMAFLRLSIRTEPGLDFPASAPGLRYSCRRDETWCNEFIGQRQR